MGIVSYYGFTTVEDLKIGSVIYILEWQRITEMVVFLHQQPAEVTEYDEQLVRKRIERIMIYEEHYAVELKSGMSVDIEKNNE